VNGTPFYLLTLVLALVLTAAGQVLFKHYYRTRKPWDRYLAVTLFVAVPVINFVSLRGLPFGLVYMSTAGTQVLVLVMSYFFLGERIPPRALPAIGLILAGIAIYGI
jgi:multidrug transporter EmrE-like cation transporter